MKPKIDLSETVNPSFSKVIDEVRELLSLDPYRILLNYSYGPLTNNYMDDKYHITMTVHPNGMYSGDKINFKATYTLYFQEYANSEEMNWLLTGYIDRQVIDRERYIRKLSTEIVDTNEPIIEFFAFLEERLGIPLLADVAEAIRL